MTNLTRSILKTVFLFLCTQFIVLTISFGQTKTDQIHALISRYADYGKFNGSVLVAEAGGVVYKKGFGLANMEWDIPNQPDTKHRIASITKQFTAMLIVQLVAENKLLLHEPISTYLPDYPKKNGDIITIHHLLTHTSGTPEIDVFMNYRDIERDRYRPEELMRLAAEQPLQFTPGSTFAYSNPGYVILGVIIETITGKSYEQVLQEKILTPLKMYNTGYDHQYTVLKNRASGYEKMYLRGTYVNTNYVDMSIPYAAGSMYSTVEDLYLWDQALYTEQLLPQKYMDLLFDAYIPAWRTQQYGYGWFLNEMPIGRSGEQVETIKHGGGINGFNTLITRIPSSRMVVVLLNNTGSAPLYEMTIAISGILYEQAYDPKKSIAYSLQAAIRKEGLAAGLAYHTEIKDSDDYYLDEDEMNIAGYEFLLAGEATEAAAMFKLNVEAFPDKFNVYDSYGEALMVLGNKARAIENYQKSVALNPKNRNGINMLKELGVEIAELQEDRFDVLKTDRTWSKEIFHFPLAFAKEIEYEGIEDARFPAGWRQTDSPDFWSYAFAWRINAPAALPKKELEAALQVYFDGLMKSVNKEKDKVLPRTRARFQKTKGATDACSYIGEVNLYDAFATQKPLTLNVTVNQYSFNQNEEFVVLFRFSPQAFDHEVWQKLKAITLREEVGGK